MNKYTVTDKSGVPHLIQADFLEVDGIKCLFLSNDSDFSVIAVFYEPISIIKIN